MRGEYHTSGGPTPLNNEVWSCRCTCCADLQFPFLPFFSQRKGGSCHLAEKEVLKRDSALCSTARGLLFEVRDMM